jgi:hypothetical protein
MWDGVLHHTSLSPGHDMPAGGSWHMVWTSESKCVVLDLQQKVSLFGPASADECRVFIHRAAALDVLRMLGTEGVAGAAMVAGGNLPVTLNG